MWGCVRVFDNIKLSLRVEREREKEMPCPLCESGPTVTVNVTVCLRVIFWWRGGESQWVLKGTVSELTR